MSQLFTCAHIESLSLLSDCECSSCRAHWTERRVRCARRRIVLDLRRGARGGRRRGVSGGAARALPGADHDAVRVRARDRERPLAHVTTYPTHELYKPLGISKHRRVTYNYRPDWNICIGKSLATS